MEIINYKIKLQADDSTISEIEKRLERIQGTVNKIKKDELLIKINFDTKNKNFWKTIQDIGKLHPELQTKFVYDIN